MLLYWFLEIAKINFGRPYINTHLLLQRWLGDGKKEERKEGFLSFDRPVNKYIRDSWSKYIWEDQIIKIKISLIDWPSVTSCIFSWEFKIYVCI